MLRHEDSSEPLPLQNGNAPASQVRVTAEELARAVARSQARREAAAQRLEGTLTIGEAVQELGLDVTPEELLAEVQAERAVQQTPPGAAKPRWGIVAAGLCALVLLGSGLGLMTHRTSSSVPGEMPAIRTITVSQSPSLIFLSAPDAVLVQDSSGPQSVLRTLGEVPDGRPVRAALNQTETQAAFAGFSDPGTSWTLIKYGGRVYVRAWIAAMSPTALRTSAVSLYRDRPLVPSGVAPQAVTLPVNGFQVTPGGDDDTLVTQHVRPDAHFAEAW